MTYHPEAITEALNLVRDHIERHLKNEVVAAVLIGSISRGEAVSYERDGKIVYLSDIEFMIVLKAMAMQADNEGWRRDLVNEIKLKMKEKGAEIDVSVGLTTRGHLRRLKPHIFTLEFQQFGQVFYGEPEILNDIPDYNPEDLYRLDALVLLNNRIVEQLKAFLRIHKQLGINQYELDKGYIQIVNSLISFEKRYRSLYPAKEAEFGALVEGPNGALSALGLDVAAYDDAFMRIGEKDFLWLENEDALNAWRKLKIEFEKALCYEVTQVLNYDDVSLDNAVRYLLSIPDLIDCAKGWIKALKKGQRLFSPNELWLRVWHTSPQYLIYHQAAKIYFSEEPDLMEIEQVIERWEQVVK